MNTKKNGISYIIKSSGQEHFLPDMQDHLSFDTETIDLVQSEVLPENAATEAGVMEINRVLRPGGRLLLYAEKSICKAFLKACRKCGILYVTSRKNTKGNLICGVKPFILNMAERRTAVGLRIQSDAKTLLFHVGHLSKKYAKIRYYEKISDRIEPRIFYACYHFPDEKGKPVTYFLGEGVNAVKNKPDDATVLTIPEGDYAVFTVIPGSRRNYTRATLAMKRYVYQYWLNITAYERLEDGIDIEFYDYRSADFVDGEFEIWIPVRQRKDENQ